MRLPRIKPEHVPYQTTAGNVRIGSGVYGIAAEIEDPDRWVWTLVSVTDGTRTPADIVNAVREVHPDVPDGDVQDALSQLIAAGYVEDIGATPPDEDFSARQQERYRRSMQYFRLTDLTARSSPWDCQRILTESRVVLIGLGGTGGAAALALAASGIGQLHCIDSDTVELSNLNRQTLYTEEDLGKSKVDAALARLRRLNSDIDITGEQLHMGSQDDITKAIDGCDLMALCADRPDDIRRWANRAALAGGVGWVDGGYHGPLITAGGYVPGSGACWECLRETENARRHLPILHDEDLVKALPRVPGHPVSAVSAGLSGLLVAHLVIALLTKTFSVQPGTVYGLNLMAPGDPVLVAHARRVDCGACA